MANKVEWFNCFTTGSFKAGNEKLSLQVEVLAKGEEYDVLVIGGGATGCGIALDSISRGAFALLQTITIPHIAFFIVMNFKTSDWY